MKKKTKEPKECPRARHHRPGTYCKACEKLIR